MTQNITEQRKININELPSEIPDFSSSVESKDSLVKKWIISWITTAISKNKIKENDILPKKSEISAHLGVSIGTVQNAIRYVEDEGYLISKQKKGTMISNATNPITTVNKSTSKRDKTILAVKKAILQNNSKIGKPVLSTRKMSDFLGISQNTVRLAYEYLCSKGILESLQIRGNDSNWYLLKMPKITSQELDTINSMEADTLVDKLIEDIKVYLANNYNIGDKIPSHETLAAEFNVSVKTINDAIKELVKQSIVITRRGKYGSILAQNPLSPVYEPLKENSIFAKASDSAFYSYQKTETKIRDFINKNYNAGDKIPSMLELSKMFDVSTNTIRKALISLEQEGFVTFSRGKYGGTFVIERPINNSNQQYQWIAINSDFI